MKKFQVLTDSTSDLTKEDREKYDISYIKMRFEMHNQDGSVEEYPADLDWEKLPAKDFYNRMRKGDRAITLLTRHEEFREKLQECFDKNLDVLYIACSSKLSGTINNCRLVLSEMENKNNNRVLFFDSLRSNYAEGLIAIDAAKMANEGKSIEETLEYIEKHRFNYNLLGTVADLKYLKNAGRVKASAAFFGNLLGVKPILCGDAAGNNFAYKKVRGRAAALQDLIETTVARVDKTPGTVIHVEHADCLGEAEIVKKGLEAKLPNHEIIISYVGPIIGATVGPDTITINFFGELVTMNGDNK